MQTRKKPRDKGEKEAVRGVAERSKWSQGQRQEEREEALVELYNLILFKTGVTHLHLSIL